MELSERIQRAQTDAAEMESLVADYLPFIKKEASKVGGRLLEYDDKVSLGMLVFVNCVRQYQPVRGSFVSFASVCIRNRLLDMGTKQSHIDGQTQRPPRNGEDAGDEGGADKASLHFYSLAIERRILAEEIDALAQDLKRFDITYETLSKNGPRQKRSRELCMQLAQAVVQDEKMWQSLFENRKLQQVKLAGQFAVSEKTVEKYRRYIVALAVILKGDYPAVRAYLPRVEKGGET